MTIFLQIIPAFLIGFFLVLYAIPIIVRISIEKHLFDVPNARKVTKHVVPNLGGIALFVGISISTLLCIMKETFPDLRYILVGMIILFFIGVKDDILVISPRKKFIAQMASALIIIVLGDIRLTHFYGIFGLQEINYLASTAISLLAIVAIINAVNLIDGIDGLAAGIGIIASGLFGAIFIQNNNIQYAILCFATLGSLTSFLFFNVFGRKNKIFMGDTGALILGLLLSIFAIEYNEISITLGVQERNFSPILSLAILSVPLFDMIRLFTLRIFEKKSPFAPDMNHIHHQLLKIGLSHRICTLIILTGNLFIIGITYTSRSLNNNISLVILISTILVLAYIPKFIYEHLKSKNRRKYLIPDAQKSDSVRFISLQKRAKKI